MTAAEHAHTQAPNFNHNFHNPDRESLMKRMGKWAGEHKGLSTFGIGGLVGAIAAASVVALSTDRDAPSSLHEQANRPGIGAPVFPGQEIPHLAGDYDGNGIVTDEEYDMMPPAEFAELDDRTRVSDVGAKLHHYMPGALTELSRHTSPRESRVLSMPDISKDRSRWTDQDYLNYYSIALLLVSGQGDQQSQIDEGKRALSVVMSPDHTNFSTVNNSIGKVDGIKSVYEALPSPSANQELRSGVYGEYSIGAEGGRLVLANYIPEGNAKEVKQYMLFVNRSDDKGNTVSMLTESFTPGDSRLSLFSGQ